MKRIYFTVVVTLFCIQCSSAQLLTWTPDFAKDNDNIAITVDATKGNQGLHELYSHFRCICTYRGYHQFQYQSY